MLRMRDEMPRMRDEMLVMRDEILGVLVYHLIFSLCTIFSSARVANRCLSTVQVESHQ